MVAQSGAHGIGLFRTEFLFMNRDTAVRGRPGRPTAVIETMAGDAVTIRVLDWGGEKYLSPPQSSTRIVTGSPAMVSTTVR